jgi:hypothetical protein
VKGIAIAAALAVLAATGGAVLWRRRRSERAPERAAERRRWRCRCGTVYEVAGTDRHRIYWLDSEPVIGKECVRCGAPLAAEHERVAV